MTAGRNDPCPCGSGRKYKHCCGRTAEAPSPEVTDVIALNGLMSQARFAEAEARANALLRSQPGSGALWKILSLALLRQGKDPLVALVRAAELLPEDAEVHGNLGAALHARGEREAALGSLRRALTLEPRNPVALTSAGDIQRELGNAREAVALYQLALQIEPKRREALNNLGSAFLDLGQPAQAARSYQRALELKPDDALVLCNFGNALRQLGKFPDAEACSRAAIARAPQMAMAHNNLGLCLGGQGQWTAATASYRQALSLDPQYAEALINLGNALREQGQRLEALEVYQQAVRAHPNRAEVHSSLAFALLEVRRLREATVSFGNALAIRPNDLSAHIGLASTQRAQGRSAEAHASAQAALAIEPDNARTLQLLGDLQADRGEFAEAERLWQRALELHPQFAAAYASIATHRRMSAQDGAWLKGVQGLLALSLPIRDEMDLRYALGKYFDDTGAFEQAFEQYQQANALSTRHRASYDGPKLTARVDRIIELCRPEWFAQTHRYASQSELPVFIIGMPRAGASLAEQILASHPQVRGAGEIRFWDMALDELEAATREPAQLADAVPGAARAYLQRLPAQGAAHARIIDAMPANFLYAGLIHAVFPRARIIHMRRDPLDTCVSLYFQNFFNVGAYANDLGNLAHYYGEYLRICGYWRGVLPGTALLEVPYEGLIEDPEGWGRRMVEFLGLPWDARCLDFRNAGPALTPGPWQFRQRLNADSIGRWRNYAKYLAPLEHLAPAAPGIG